MTYAIQNILFFAHAVSASFITRTYLSSPRPKKFVKLALAAIMKCMNLPVVESNHQDRVNSWSFQHLFNGDSNIVKVTETPAGIERSMVVRRQRAKACSPSRAVAAGICVFIMLNGRKIL